MDNTTLYKEQLLRFLERDDEQEAMLDWIEELPKLDQPDVFRLLTSLLQERGKNTGEQEWIVKANQITEKIDKFEEEILDNKLDKKLFTMQLEGTEFDLDKIELFLIKNREDIIEKMGSNPENYKELLKLATSAINTEKSFGIYDPANWREIL